MSTCQAGAVCAGLYSSASTWAFNITAELLRDHREGRLATIYADNLDDRATEAIKASDCFVVKSHMPDASICALCAEAMLPVVMTIRDPCDAIASLMLRFGQDFDGALNAVGRSAEHLLTLQHQSKPIVLRYESSFTTNHFEIARIAFHLGVVVGEGRIDQLLRLFTPSAVTSRITNLLAKGVLSGRHPLLEWEEGTHWHPFHIGDGRVGKSKDVLSAQQIEATICRTAAFCEFYGYSGNLRVGSQTSEAPYLGQGTITGWIDDFVPPDLVYGWVGNILRGPPVQIIALLEERQVGNSVADLDRPDLVQLGNGFHGFQLRLERPFRLTELVQRIRFHLACGDVDLGVIPITWQLAQRAGIGAETSKYDG